jgi:DNA-binding Xre family transcriptional regulator
MRGHSTPGFPTCNISSANAVSNGGMKNIVIPLAARVPSNKALSLSLKQLGDNIRRERMAKNVTQQRLAELADLNIRNVQRIEAGESDVLFSTLARIKKALGCSWDILIPKSWN